MPKSTSLLPLALEETWWEIAVTRDGDLPAEPDRSGILMASLIEHHRVDRAAMQRAHRDQPHADIGLLLRKLTQGRRFEVRMSGDLMEGVVRDDFRLPDADASALGFAICKRLLPTMTTTDRSVLVVVEPTPFLRRHLYHACAARIERAVRYGHLTTGRV